MINPRPVLLIVLLGCAVASQASAQESQPGDTMRGSTGMAKSDRVPAATSSGSLQNAKERWAMTHRASKIIGTEVRNPDGEHIGEIKEIVLDPRSGNVAYAVVSFGGILGIGDKLFAVPWKALKLDNEDNTFMLNVEKERLRNAPGFDPDRWPDMANVQWNTDVHKFYGQRYDGSASGKR